MSTRRSTRAAGRASASPAPSNLTASTTHGRTPARRSIRDIADLPPLPALGAQPSTAYGSTMTAVPITTASLRPGREIGSALADILAPARNSPQKNADTIDTPASPAPTRSRRGRGSNPRDTHAGDGFDVSVTSTPAFNNRTFGNESGVYGNATFQATPASFGNPVTAAIAEEPDADTPEHLGVVAGSTSTGLWPQSIDEQWENLHRLREAERLSALSNVTRAFSGLALNVFDGISYALSEVAYVFRTAWTTFKTAELWKLMLLVFVICAPLGLLGYESQLPAVFSYGRDQFFSATDTVSQLFESTSKSAFYSKVDKHDLEQRISIIEREMSRLKKRTQLDQEAIHYIEKQLPDFVVFRKGKDGQKQVPTQFWHAIKSLIRAESPIIKDYLIDSGTVHSASGDVTETQVKKIAKSTWSEFLRENEERVGIWQGDNSDEPFRKSLKAAFRDDILVSKSDFMDIIKQQYADSQRLIKTEISRLDSQVSHQLRNASPEPHEPNSVGVTESQAKAIAQDTVRKLGHSIMLEALANHKLRQTSSDSLKRVNHFSPSKGGAVVNVKYTTPKFAMPSSKSGLVPRLLTNVLGWGLPKANEPIVALTKWDEAGECWCAPAKGKGPVQIAVLMQREIYPDEIVIEHVPATSTLDPNAAPRRIEVFAKIQTDSRRLDQIVRISSALFPDAVSEEILNEKFIRVARFSYDPFNDHDHFRQSFQVTLDLKNIGIPTDEMVVRVLSNAGADHTCLYRVMVHGDVAE